MQRDKRLIDANRLLRDPYFQEDRYPESHLLRMAIGEQPTVDAVEVDALRAWLYEMAMNNVGVPEPLLHWRGGIA